MTASKNVCSLVNVSIEANSVDLHCLSKRLQIFQRKKHATFCDMCFKVNKCEFNVYTVTIFMKCMHVCAAQTTY